MPQASSSGRGYAPIGTNQRDCGLNQYVCASPPLRTQGALCPSIRRPSCPRITHRRTTLGSPGRDARGAKDTDMQVPSVTWVTGGHMPGVPKPRIARRTGGTKPRMTLAQAMVRSPVRPNPATHKFAHVSAARLETPSAREAGSVVNTRAPPRMH